MYMWNKLSMADRYKYIQLGVQNGITSLDVIRDTYNSYAKEQGLVNRFGEGGNVGGGVENEEYTPATLAGWVTQLVTGDDTKAAYTDIGSSTINTGADAIPIVGNALGAVISIGDTLYDTGKFIFNPSWKNATDVGSSLLGIVPGVGSIKDVKNIAKATKQTVENVKTTKSIKAVGKTIARKANPKSNVRVNVLKSDMKVSRSYPLQLTTNPYFKLIGTVGNWWDTVEDTGSALDYLYTK